jgi:hypothetical protein
MGRNHVSPAVRNGTHRHCMHQSCTCIIKFRADSFHGCADSHRRSHRCQQQHRQRSRRQASLRHCECCNYVHRLKRPRDDEARAQLGAHVEHVSPRPCSCQFLSCHIIRIHSRQIQPHVCVLLALFVSVILIVMIQILATGPNYGHGLAFRRFYRVCSAPFKCCCVALSFFARYMVHRRLLHDDKFGVTGWM